MNGRNEGANMEPTTPPSYGQSAHYLGRDGEAYFSWQNQGGMQRGRINARKFSKHIQPSDTVLDFGCGNGALLLNLICQHRIGVEINPVAREECQKLGLEVCGTLADVPDACAHVAISNHALEHISYPLQALRELRSKLIRGGRLALCVPIDDWRTQRHVNVKDINRHLYTWTPLLMGNLLDEAGYTVREIRVYTHAWPLYWEWLDMHLPVPLFDLICAGNAWLSKRRQIIAVASNDQ